MRERNDNPHPPPLHAVRNGLAGSIRYSRGHPTDSGPF